MSSFAALMALASKQTEASQIALAKDTQIRQAREKAKRLEEERKEKERITLEKERLAKQKLDDERREQRLREERQRKMAERLAAAELARKQQQLILTPATPNSRVNHSTTSRSQRTAPRASSSTPTLNHHQDPEEQRMLDREEKKARARARLFGEPVSAHKKATTSRTGTQSTPRTKATSKNNMPQRRTPYGIQPQTLSGGPSTSLSARQRIEQEFSINVRKPLNQIKKDRRTIEEIERDMKQKKALPFVGTSSLSRKTQELSLEREAEKQSNRSSKPTVSYSVSNEHHQRSQRPALESTSTFKRKLSTPSAAPPSKRPLGLTKSTTQKVTDTQISASGSKPFHSNNTHKSRGNQSHHDDDSESEEFSDHDDVPVAPSIRDEIWKIMGKDRKLYTAKPIYSDEDGSDDMEADIDDVLEEEGRAARLARLEDQREEERLRQHESEKKKKKLLQNRLSK